MKKLIFILLIAALSICSLSACGQVQQPDIDAPQGILCTNFPAYDFCRQIVGDKLPVELIVPPGADSHSFEPTARDMLRMGSWLLVCNGGEGEAWVEELYHGGALAYEPLYMTACVSLLEEEHKEGMQDAPHAHEPHDEGEHHHDESCEHGHGEEMEYDEHVWTSPVNAIYICREICDRLCEYSPENADYFKENLSVYTAELEKLDGDFRALVEDAEYRCLVFADRFPVRYFVEEYGLEYYAAFPGCAAETEPSARTVAFLIDRVREDDIPAVFYIEFSNEKMADIICEDTGCKKLLFHSAHNVSLQELEAGISYLEIMRANLENLKEALY